MPTRRALLTAAGTAATAGMAGCTGLGGDGGGDGSDGGDGDGNDGGGGGSTPTGPVATAPVPDNPGSYTYARMGTGAEATITYVGNWKCPYCAEFSTGSERVLSLATIATEYVVPGDFDLAYRALCYGSDGEPFLGPDAPRAGRAGLAVWNVDPASYWAYHEHVMASQPPESEQWATRSKLVEFARAAGVSDPDAVGSAIGDGSYESEVRANTEFAANAGVGGTPTVVVDGTGYSPFQPDELRSALDSFAE